MAIDFIHERYDAERHLQADTTLIQMSDDPLILAMLRTLGLWLSEDETGGTITVATAEIEDALRDLQIQSAKNQGFGKPVNLQREISFIIHSLNVEMEDSDEDELDLI